jgi:hypothetical protein
VLEESMDGMHLSGPELRALIGGTELVTTSKTEAMEFAEKRHRFGAVCLPVADQKPPKPGDKKLPKPSDITGKSL